MSAHQNGDYFWYKEDADKKCVFIGLTQLGLEYCGNLQKVDIQFQQDEVFSKGDVVFLVEGIHSNLEYLAESDGKIADINLLAQEDPEVVNDDPLEEGWVIAIEKAI